MDDLFQAIVAALPNAASSPFALIAYLATIISWSVIAFRVRTLAGIQENIKDLAEPDRFKILRDALGTVDVKTFKAEELIRLKRHQYIFLGFLALCATGIVVVAVATYQALDKRALTNALIQKALEPPSADFMSAINVLNSGPSTISNVAATIEPMPSEEELSAYVDRLVLQGYDYDSILRMLRENSGGGQLQSVNANLLDAAQRIDENFSDLEQCFINQRCVSSAQKFPSLCQTLNRVISDVASSNRAALQVPGMMFVESGMDPMFGGGVMAVLFEEIKVRNSKYLHELCNS